VEILSLDPARARFAGKDLGRRMRIICSSCTELSRRATSCSSSSTWPGAFHCIASFAVLLYLRISHGHPDVLLGALLFSLLTIWFL